MVMEVIHNEDRADRQTETLTPEPLSRRAKEGEKNQNDLYHFLNNLHKRGLGNQ